MQVLESLVVGRQPDHVKDVGAWVQLAVSVILALIVGLDEDALNVQLGTWDIDEQLSFQVPPAEAGGVRVKSEQFGSSSVSDAPCAPADRLPAMTAALAASNNLKCLSINDSWIAEKGGRIPLV